MTQNNRTNYGANTPFMSVRNAQNQTRKQGGGVAAAIWGVIALAYVGISAVADSGEGRALVIGLVAVVVAIAVAVIVIKAAKMKSAGSSASPQGHICETPEEHASSERSAASTLDEMESGYRAYSYSTNEVASHESYVYKRIRKMTPEEYRKKLEELDSLLEAGMMTHAEHAEKKREYAQATRGI